MNKPLLVYQAPIATRSGYGDHSRDILKSLFELDKYDVKVVPTRWGNTPQDQINPQSEFGKRVLSSLATQVSRKPDIFIQVSVANEFKRVGEYNIGITAGVESTIAPQEFIKGGNQMDLIITPSEFTKEILVKTGYTEVDKETKKEIAKLELNRPVEVLFEGVDTSIFNGKSKSSILDSVDTDFNFLFVGHWLAGGLGHDRKDVGMMIKTFCTVFKSIPKDKQPGFILKTSHAGFSVGDREKIASNIKSITEEYGDKCPPIHLIFGDLSESELNDLYNDDKVKAMVSFTKGEGYGRPLAEFATTGKPIIVSNWSGFKDFLPEEHTLYLDGELKNVDASAANKFLLKESKWFYVNYSKAAQILYKTFDNYTQSLKQSQGLKTNINKNFTLDKMTSKLGELLDKYVKVAKKVEMKLPTINKL
jgi:glycosyltransferase involved in cell wall biosynthesis|tara:strand:- start:2188 stop:3447 length:1260 start_codon:yes stop_codon:yes gene_type:complete